MIEKVKERWRKCTVAEKILCVAAPFLLIDFADFRGACDGCVACCEQSSAVYRMGVSWLWVVEET